MTDIKKLASGLNADATPQDMREIENKTDNLYRSISIIAKRSNQISSQLKEELHAKLEEFATTSDTLEEVSENREQIEISRFYERLPNPAVLATKEFLDDQVYFRNPEEDEE